MTDNTLSHSCRRLVVAVAAAAILFATNPVASKVLPPPMNGGGVWGTGSGGGGDGDGELCLPVMALGAGTGPGPEGDTILSSVQGGMDAARIARIVSPVGLSMRGRLPGQNGVPRVVWGGSGLNSIGTAGPSVTASVNGAGGSSSVFLGNGASYVNQVDFYLPLNGIDWFHERVYSSKNASSQNWQGRGWWGNEMMKITVAGTDGASDVTVRMDPHHSLHFDYSGGSWTCEDNYLYTLTFSAGQNEYRLKRADGYTYVFHDRMAFRGAPCRLKKIIDAYGNKWSFSWGVSNGGMEMGVITVDVVEGNDHRITYTYFGSGDNYGLLRYIKVYKSTTTTDANLIGQVEYVYHDSTSDDYGSEDDLMKVIVKRKATADGDGVLSIEETYYYRYYKGTYDSETNPGTNHQLRFVLLPENADRLNTAKGNPLTQSNDDFDDYANIIYEYHSNGRVRKTQERLPGTSCGCGGAGGTPATTTYTWTENGGTPDLDTWKIHCVADREDDTRVIFDVNRRYHVLTWVVQNEDDGSPTRELIWHFDYGTSGATENRLTAVHNPSACSDYSESAPYSVTLRSSDGVIYEIDYDYTTDTYDGYPERIRIKKGTGGTAETLKAYARTISERPDLATTVTEYESIGESDGRSTTLAYTFYDSGGDKVKPKQIDITHPSVSTAKNGPGASAVENQFFDKRTGALRWKRNGEGYVEFYAYDDETGIWDLTVLDVNTSSLPQVVDDNWDGVAHGGLASDDSVPFSRTGSGTALNIDGSNVIDWLGRTRKTVDPEGQITYYVYKDDETRVYPAWNTSTYKTLLPIRVAKTDKESRPEDVVTLKNTVTPTKDGNNEPTGAETYGNSDMATRAINSFNISGMPEHRDIYHAFSASGTGTRYTHYYRTSYEYDDMGRQEYAIEDVADESTYDREQVTRNYYDFLGRRIKVDQGVSDDEHDIGVSKPTTQMVTTVEYFYDDPNSDSTPEQGAGDGNLRWVRRWYGTGANDHNDTEYRFDWHNRRCLTIPPLAPYTLVKYDHLGRVITTGTYSATTNLDPGDDPATTENGNRLSLSKTYYDEWGRVYKTERFDDPSAATPVNELATNTYYDRRRLVWAVDAPNTGIRFTKYNGAGRRTQTFSGTQFDTNKYTSNAPDYPDDDEGITRLTEYTLNEKGNVTKTITKELNHDDTDGMDLTNNDDYIRTYVYNWYDAAFRLTGTATYGTNNDSGWKDNSTAPTYYSSPPASSDTILVTTYTYNSDGRREKVTDPKGIMTLSALDKLGRVTEKKEDYYYATERITKYEYNAQGSLTKITADLTTDQVTEYVYGSSQNARWVTKIKYPATDTDNGKTIGQPSDETYDRITFTYNADGTLTTRTDQNGTVLTWSYDTLRRKTEEEVTTLGSYTGGAGAVDGAIRAITWKYNNEGRVEYVTSHTDTNPDTTNWTDATNQIKYTYNSAGKLTKVEQEENGKVVGGTTLAVEYGYDTDYDTKYYNRREYIEYPNDRKIWNFYAPPSDPTFQETINDKFSRVGEITRDNGGSSGDTLAKYYFNGLSRMVRRVHDEAGGAYGNDTRMDLWHESETSGWYKGLDRFGRIVDMKHTDFSGTATDFIRRKYGYDRNSNRTWIEHALYKADSNEFTYDRLNRLTKAERGVLDSYHEVIRSDLAEEYKMDLLGNLTTDAGGLRMNLAASATVTQDANATNEITSITWEEESNSPWNIEDEFVSLSSDLWTQHKGTWISSDGKAKVTALTSYEAILLTVPEFDVASYVVDIRFPTESSDKKAGVVFGHDGDDDYYAVVLDRDAGKFALHKITNGSWGSALDSDSMTISDETTYTVEIKRQQRRVEAYVDDESIVYDGDTVLSSGYSGFFSDKTDVTFDNFKVGQIHSRDPYQRGSVGIKSEALPGLGDEGGEHPMEAAPSFSGEAVVEGFFDDDYMVQVDFLGNGTYGDIVVRRIDRNNGYRLRLFTYAGTNMKLYRLENGKVTQLDSGSYTLPSHPNLAAFKIKVSGSSIKAWADGSLEIDTTDSAHAAGGVAMASDQAVYDNLKIGYDNNSDDDIDDAGDDIVIDEDFSGDSITASHDHAGNMIDDGTFRYVFDAWNRLIKVQSSKDSGAVTFQTAEFDGMGRRMKKVVTNSGDHDGTVVYFYDGQKIIETRDGSGYLYQQFIHGTQYIDELVMIRVKYKGDLYVHQDANWNVIGLSDLGGHLVERYVLTPYGELTVYQETGFGDYDEDNDVMGAPPSTSDPDYTAFTGACAGSGPTGACRILDLDFDGDVDTTDRDNYFMSLPHGLMRHPGRIATAVHQPFGHQGLLYEPELGQYQNRARQYDPTKRTFAQRDPAKYRDAMNLYVYLKGLPTRLVDPTGRACCENPSENFPDNWKGFICCDCILPAPLFCEMQICVNPTWADSVPPVLVDCIRVHEVDHTNRNVCRYESGKCEMYGPEDDNYDECLAYAAEYECLNDCVGVCSPETDERCDKVRCMMDNICPDANSPGTLPPYGPGGANEACTDAPSTGGCSVG